MKLLKIEIGLDRALFTSRLGKPQNFRPDLDGMYKNSAIA